MKINLKGMKVGESIVFASKRSEAYKDAEVAIKRIQAGQKYGDDMLSSAVVAYKDAISLLNKAIIALSEEENENAQWGFDLTSISASHWKKILETGGISEKPSNEEGVWVWKGPNIKIHTGNDPISGEYGSRGRRPNEKGYASYIGLYGNADIVKKLAGLIRRLADSIKGESKNKSEFI